VTFARKPSWGSVERGPRNVGVVNIQRIAGALGMSLSEPSAEGRGITYEEAVRYAFSAVDWNYPGVADGFLLRHRAQLA
jgi:hypothetical protein